MVQENLHCKEIQEQFPMAFNGKLTDRQIGSIKEHMRSCDDCHRSYQAERALYVMADGDSGEQLLATGVDSSLLDQFAFDYESLTPDQEEAVVQYAKSTQGGRDIIGKLRGLPPRLEGLVAAKELPLISAVDKEAARSFAAPPRPAITRLWVGLWRPAAALAAVAVVIMVFFSQWTNPDHLSIEARTKAVFPAAQRSAQPLVFDTDRSPCILDAQVFADPEPGHEYSVEIHNVVDDAVVYQTQRLQQFDTKGFARLSVPLDTGLYRLQLLDMEGSDTLMIVWEFNLQLSR
ncbi:MAG: hypothetical protein ABIE70_03785 [bacterium]